VCVGETDASRRVNTAQDVDRRTESVTTGGVTAGIGETGVRRGVNTVMKGVDKVTGSVTPVDVCMATFGEKCARSIKIPVDVSAVVGGTGASLDVNTAM
jgi:hypothetical protein